MPDAENANSSAVMYSPVAPPALGISADTIWLQPLGQ